MTGNIRVASAFASRRSATSTCGRLPRIACCRFLRRCARGYPAPVRMRAKRGRWRVRSSSPTPPRTMSMPRADESRPLADLARKRSCVRLPARAVAPHRRAVPRSRERRSTQLRSHAASGQLRATAQQLPARPRVCRTAELARRRVRDARVPETNRRLRVEGYVGSHLPPPSLQPKQQPNTRPTPRRARYVPPAAKRNPRFACDQPTAESPWR